MSSLLWVGNNVYVLVCVGNERTAIQLVGDSVGKRTYGFIPVDFNKRLTLRIKRESGA
jgi:hypothetical protein